jgi:hypothetical protein
VILRFEQKRHLPAKYGDGGARKLPETEALDWVAVDAVCCEPFSPETGKSTGKILEPTRRVEPIPQAESALANRRRIKLDRRNREKQGILWPRVYLKHRDGKDRSLISVAPWIAGVGLLILAE